MELTRKRRREFLHERSDMCGLGVVEERHFRFVYFLRNRLGCWQSRWDI